MYARAPNTNAETLIYSTYYAPRGRQRLYILAGQLSERYLYPDDLLIGVIGAEGAGKSTLIKGLFPGLELVNDDDGVNMTPAPIYAFDPNDFFCPHTFHLDVRYELAFKQKHEVVDAINVVINHGRRVVAEHFDLIYDALNYNAQVIFAIGEEVIVTRPSVFGPFPREIKTVVDKTIKYRLMAHSAEDLTTYILERDHGYERGLVHSDVMHGFVLNFPELPEIDIAELEQKVKDLIAEDIPLQAAADNLMKIGEDQIYCTGTRTHVKSTGDIKRFRLLKDYKYNPITREYLLVGMVGSREIAGFEDMIDTMSLQDAEAGDEAEENPA